MGLESKNKRRLPAGSGTACRAELSKTLRVEVVVKKRGEDGDKSVKGVIVKEMAFKGVLVG